MINTEILEPPTQSPADKKSYRSIRLSNGLTALLIHDVATDGDEKLRRRFFNGSELLYKIAPRGQFNF